jgi:plastocyanin
MSQLPTRSLRLRSYTTVDLDRLTGEKGEIFYDYEKKTLKVYNGAGTTASSLAVFEGGGRLSLGSSSGAVYANQTTGMITIGDYIGTNGQPQAPSTVVQIGGATNAFQISAYGPPARVWTFARTGALTLPSAGNLTFPDATVQTTAWTGVADYNNLTNKPVIPGIYSFSVAADDSTQRVVNTDEVVKFIGAGGITTSSDAEGNITITGSGSIGSVTFVGTTIDSVDSSAITFTPSVVFDSDITVGTDIVFPDGSRQSTSAVGIPGPKGDQGEPGASGSGSGDVLSAGGGYVDNRIVRYDGTTGTIIQVSSASISDAGLLTATSFSGAGALITALNATELTSGTIPDARFPATLPAASGANLTALNATQLTSGTVPIGRIGATGTPSASTYLRGDNSWATVSGGTASDSFATIAVAGQSSVAADSATDTLTLVAGTNITITTDAATDSITINSTASGGATSDSFATIAVAGQSSVVADSGTDTLTLVAGTGISITTNASTDTITITNSVSAGATAFTGLSDVSAAGLTVDEFYLPAITRLDVTANGISAYRFDQYSTTDNPTIYAISGTTIAFNFASLGSHPFLIRFSGANYSTGLVHVSTGGTVLTGASAQGQTTGTLYWKIPAGISGTYGYLCGSHGGMNGTITVKDISAI